MAARGHDLLLCYSYAVTRTLLVDTQLTVHVLECFIFQRAETIGASAPEVKMGAEGPRPTPAAVAAPAEAPAAAATAVRQP